MIPYNKERIDNAILFFAKEYKRKTRKYLYQTQLYKFLGFFDFMGQERFGTPPLNLEYVAMERGPVPIEIYKNRNSINESLYSFEKIENEVYQVYPKGKVNLDFFSKNEIELMKELIEIYADIFVKTKDISDASHQRINAWKKTWNTKPNSLIDYDLTFNADIYDKNSEKLSIAEENYITFKTLQS